VVAVGHRQGDINIARSSGAILGKCHACTGRDKLLDNELALHIDLDACAIHLCTWHESMLLSLLLANHCKRARKRAATNTKPDYFILKQTPEEEEDEAC
jgi:hypothetical protein